MVEGGGVRKGRRLRAEVSSPLMAGSETALPWWVCFPNSSSSPGGPHKPPFTRPFKPSQREPHGTGDKGWGGVGVRERKVGGWQVCYEKRRPILKRTG